MIIIGLLVAGITGGASLIESAKIRAFTNELNSYKQAVATFKVAKGRLPGDLNNDGCIGYFGNIPGCVKETYEIGDFKEPFNEMEIDADQSPFVELYLEKLIDYDENNNYDLYPYSKIFKDEKKGYGYYKFDIVIGVNSEEYYSYNLKESGELFLDYKYSSLDPEIYKKVDLIIDDGLFNSGNIRAYIRSSETNSFLDYDQAIDEFINGSSHVISFYYKINL